MESRNYRLKWTDNSREYRLCRTDFDDDDWNWGKKVGSHPAFRSYWGIYRAGKLTYKTQRNWKRYRKTQHKIE